MAGQGQNPYGMGGYGYQQGGGGYDQYSQQQQMMWQQQMQWQQQQQQWQGGGYGQQQWGGYGGQQQQQQQQQQGGGKGGGKGGFGGGQGNSGAGAQAAPKKKANPNEMTYEEFQAAEKEKKEKKAKEKAEREAAAKAAAAARAAGNDFEAPMAKEEEVKKEAPQKYVPPGKRTEQAPAPKKEESAPAKKEAAPADDWEAEADAAAAPAPAPAPEPVKEEKKEEKRAPAKKEEKKEEKKPEPAAPAAQEAAEEEPVVEEPPVKDSDLQEPDPRPHLNVVFIGHVDAGKSTTCGNILFLSGCVDDRTVEKYMKEAKDKNRESWFLAYIMDTSDEEKAKGKTVEVGRAHFETPNRRFTILDAPGHKSYVPNMISGASQADIGVLIISARKGEFETGFERGGQTREHALLAKTLGVEKLLLCVNKMDDDSVQWAQERYDEIQKKMAPFLKTAGFKDEQVVFLPVSGLKGHNIKERLDTPAWFTGKTLLDEMDSAEIPRPSKEAPLRIPMLDGYRDMGAIMAIGKVEQGTVKPGMKCVIMPIGQKCTVHTTHLNDVPMKFAKVGENVTLKMTGCTEEQLSKGFVLCDAIKPIRVVTKFKAMMQVIELPEERPVLTSGYKCVMHAHVASEECEVLKLYEACPMNNVKKKEQKPKFVRENSVAWVSIQLARPTALDVFTGCSQLGRFTLRDEGRTVAIGKIIELPKEK